MPRGKAEAKPRGRMTAYAFFVQTCREEHKKKHPEENVIFAEFSKKCSERWKVSIVRGEGEGKRVCGGRVANSGGMPHEFVTNCDIV